MNIISWTPAGRRKYLEILIPNIYKIKKLIKKHVFFINTQNQEDINYIKSICRKDDFFQYCEGNANGGLLDLKKGYKHILNYPAEYYLRFDDDICCVANNLIKVLLKQMEDNFMVSPFIVNNGICSFYYNHFYNLVNVSSDYHVMNNFWKSNEFGAKIHRNFLQGNLFKKASAIPNWIIHPGEHFSVNCFLMTRNNFEICAKLMEENIGHEEPVIFTYCKRNNLLCKIINKTFACHFSYHVQKRLEANTQLLSRYSLIKEKTLL